MITVAHAPAYSAVQDLGRDGMRSQGVPPGGAMDTLALAAGNALLGNEPGTAAIEWALTGGELRFTATTSLVLSGAEADASLSDRALVGNRVYEAQAGETLVVQRLSRGRFLYICVAGGIDVPRQLGSRGTYLPAGFGGFHGRLLRAGDDLPTGEPGAGPVIDRDLPPELRTLTGDSPLALLRGPAAEELDERAWAALVAGELAVSRASDRMGYRLEGPLLRPASEAAGRSEPACPGAVQLTPSGELIVLMADGPTVGGYPKVAVIATADLPRLAQRLPGDQVRFRLADIGEARALLAARETALRALTEQARRS